MIMIIQIKMNLLNTQNENINKIDEDLYSLQIIFLDIDTVNKISKQKILVIGLRGLGIEFDKNIIVSGPKKVSFFVPNLVEIYDLGSNFYLTNNDIGKKRDEFTLLKLSNLINM